jgi:uncharacterized protein (TIGR00730 family)
MWSSRPDPSRCPGEWPERCRPIRLVAGTPGHVNTSAMTALGNVGVFCGSSPGERASFDTAATALGHALAERGIGLVYGGASVGLMGVLADAALAAGGRVTGVITTSLADHEIAHGHLTRLELVSTMHERKALMAEFSDAFIMLPGGFGTSEEFMEAVTWVHLGIHDKPCGILNVDGFFDQLLGFLAHAVEMGFIRPQLLDRVIVSDDQEALLGALESAASSVR